MPTMSDEQWRAFVSAGTRTGKLATTRADGGPHVAPVWFVLDGDDVVFMTGESTAKGRNLRRDPRACLVVDDEDPPYAFVQITGAVTLSDDLAELARLGHPISARYMGADRAEEFTRRNAVPGELLVRLTPARVVAESDIAG